jgi:hypothetical protein
MPAGSAKQKMIFHSAEQFEAYMFPRAVSKRTTEHDGQHPKLAGRRLAEEALARLKPATRARRRTR